MLEGFSLNNPQCLGFAMNNEPLPTLLRRKRGPLRQKEIAAKLDISVRTYEKWERGEAEPYGLARAELIRRLEAMKP